MSGIHLQVFIRDRVPLPGMPQEAGVHIGAHQHHRFHRHHVVLLRHAAAEVGGQPRERRHPRLFQHHPDIQVSLLFFKNFNRYFATSKT